MVMEKVVRGDRSLAVPSLQKRKGKKYDLKRKYVRGGSVGVALSTHG